MRITHQQQTLPFTDIKIRRAKATDESLKLADTANLHLEGKPNGSELCRSRIAGRLNLSAVGGYLIAWLVTHVAFRAHLATRP